MGQTDETRLADARRREAEARKEYEAAVAAVEAHPGKRRGWRERQRRAAEAASALGSARAELDAAEVAAGLREADAPAADAGDCKLLVALVRDLLLVAPTAWLLLKGQHRWIADFRRMWYTKHP